MTKQNNSILKTLLATASVASIALGSTGAFAAGTQLLTDNANAETTNAAHWDPAQAPAAGNHLKLSGAQNIILNSGAARAFGELRLDTNTGQTLTVADANNYSFTAVTHDAAEVINVVYGAAGTLTVGNTNAAIGDVDFANSAGTLTITTGDITGGVDSTNGANGTLVINGATTIDGVVGANNALTAIKVGGTGALTFGDDANAATLQYLGAGTVNLGANTFTGNVDFNGKAGTLTLGKAHGGGGAFAIIDGDVDNGGTITVSDGADATVANTKQAEVTGTIGANAQLTTLNIGTNSLFNAGGAAKIATVAFEGANSTLVLGNNLTIGTGTTGAGKVTTAGVSTLVGNLGGEAAGNTLTSVTLGGDLTLGGAGAKIYATNITGAANDIIVAADSIISGTVAGAATTVNNGKTLTLVGTTTYGSTIDGDGGGQGTLVADGTIALNAAVGGNNKLAAIKINSGTLTFGNNANAATLQYLGAGTVNLADKTFTGDVDFDGNAGTLTLGKAHGGGGAFAIIDGDVDNGGTITVPDGTGAGNNVKQAKVTGTIGANAQLTTLNIGTNSLFNAGGAAKIATVAFEGANSTLVLGNNLTIGTGTTGTGKVTTAGASTLVGNLGGEAAGNRLTSVTLGGALTLGNGGTGASIYATTVDGNQNVIVAEDSSITATTVHNNLSVQNVNILELKAIDANGLTLNNASTIGSAGAAGGIIKTTGLVIFGNAAVGNAGNPLSLNVDTGELRTSSNAASTFHNIHIGTGTLTARHNITVGGVDGLKFLGAGTVNLADKTFTGNVDFNGKAGTVNMAAGSSIVGAIADANNNGTINVTGNATIGDGGDSKIGTLSVANTFTATLHGAHTYTVNATTGTGTIATDAANAVLTGNFGTAGNVLTSLSFANAGTLNGATVVADTLQGTGGGAKVINVGAGNAAVTATNIKNATLTLGANQLTLNGGTFDANSNVTGAGGTLITTGNVAFGAATAGNAGLNLTVNGGTLNAAGAGALFNANAVTIANGATLQTGANGFTAAGNTTVSGTLTTGGAYNGNVVFGADTGTVNLANKALNGDVNFNGNNGTLIADTANGINGAVTAGGDGFGNVVIKAGGLTAHLGAAGAALNSLSVATANDGASNGKNIYAETLNVGAGAGHKFIIDNGSTIGITDVVINAGDALVLQKNGVTGSITGANGGLLLVIDPSTLAANVNVGQLAFGLAGKINSNMSAGGLAVGADLSVNAGKTLAGDSVLYIDNAKTLTASKDSTVNVGKYGIVGQGTFKAENGGVLPQIGGKTAFIFIAPGFPAVATPMTLSNLNLAGVAGTEYTANGTYKADATTVTDGVNLKLTGDSTFAGSMNLVKGNKVTLSDKALTLTGDLTVTDSATIDLDITDSSTFGKVVAKTTRIKDKTLTLNVNGSSALEVGTELFVLSNVDGAPKTLNLQTPGSLSKVVYDKGKIVAMGVDLEELEVVSKDLKESAKNPAVSTIIDQIDDIIAKGDNPGVALTVLEDSARMGTDSEKKELVVRAFNTNRNQASDVSKEVAGAVVSNIAASLSTTISAAPVSGGRTFTSLGQGAGIAAGHEDNMLRSGAWVQGFGSKATQSYHKGRSGYRSDTLGGTVGADTLVNDNLRVGFAFATANTKVKMKDDKAGDKLKAKTNVGAVFGVYEIDEAWFARATGSYAISNIKSNEKQLSPAGSKIAEASYNSSSYSLEGGVGYRHMLPANVFVMPEVSLAATYFMDEAYTEKGGAYNRSQTKRSGTAYNGSVGLSAGTTLEVRDVVIAPTLFAKVKQYLGGKNPEVSMKFNRQTGTGFVSKDKPLTRTSFNLGGDMSVRYGAMEYGVAYDANLAKKFVSHTGSLKVKVNF